MSKTPTLVFSLLLVAASCGGDSSRGGPGISGSAEPSTGSDAPGSTGGESSDAPGSTGGESSDAPGSTGGESTDAPGSTGGESTDAPGSTG
ncbi:MAG: hypothetical protein OXL98_02955, partial [Acidimicrobiaceae bacterium]|nr:hypothetical protein [Acidimicrobiaceae bacterium]